MAELGFEYRDKATGWAGVATARTVYLGDGPSVRLQRLGADGDIEEQWLPEGRLEAVIVQKPLGFGLSESRGVLDVDDLPAGTLTVEDV